MKQARNWLVLASAVIGSTVALWMGSGLATVYQNFDGPYYVVVAKSWYDKDIIRHHFSFPLPLEYYPAHFPLYPLLIRVIGQIGGGGYLNAMLAVNLAATVAASIVLYEIARRFKWGASPLIVALVWLFWWPRMWVVRSIGSPETLFILWVLLSLAFFQVKRYWLAGICGALAVLTKSPGILLFPAFVLAAKFDRRTWPIVLIPVSLLLLFTFYYLQLGDFWAYFHSGDNVHLTALPFQVFNSRLAWVGDSWLEHVVWIYLIGAIGVIRAFKKSPVWGWFGAVFSASILFVSHRDIGRYALPLVPVVLLGLAEVLAKKEIRWTLALAVIPLYFYSLNFMLQNTLAISDWAPFFAK